MRGKEVQGLLQDLVGGITPAYAGKSRPEACGVAFLRDHPRVCGEKGPFFSAVHRDIGSPPRVRGKDAENRSAHLESRITPACAGKSPAMMVCSLEYWGSPPRMRGKYEILDVLEAVLGITPACAGKSSIQHLTASLGEFEVQKGHPVPHLRQRLQVWPDHARHLRHGLILHASRSAGQGRRLCPGPCPDTAGSGTPRGPSPAKRPHRSPPAATPGGCRAWQSGATAPGSR